MKTRVLYAVLGWGLLISCHELEPSGEVLDHNKSNDNGSTPNDNANNETTTACALSVNLLGDTYYEPDAKKVLSDYCLSCHSNGGTSPDLSTYNKSKLAAPASIASIQAGRMPKNVNMPGSQLDILLAWQDNSFAFSVQSSDGCTSANPTPEPTPTTDERMLQLAGIYCAGCHSANGGESPRLTSIPQLKKQGKESYEQMQEGEMPPEAIIPAADKTFMMSWLKANGE